MVANCVENMDSHYSIRKYKTTGGSEVILKEEGLKKLTRIDAVYFFNNKLHAAIIYREELAGNNGMNNYHMQIICQK